MVLVTKYSLLTCTWACKPSFYMEMWRFWVLLTSLLDLICRHMLSCSHAKDNPYLFHHPVICDGLRGRAYGTFRYGIAWNVISVSSTSSCSSVTLQQVAQGAESIQGVASHVFGAGACRPLLAVVLLLVVAHNVIVRPCALAVFPRLHLVLLAQTKLSCPVDWLFLVLACTCSTPSVGMTAGLLSFHGACAVSLFKTHALVSNWWCFQTRALSSPG